MLPNCRKLSYLPDGIRCMVTVLCYAQLFLLLTSVEFKGQRAFAAGSKGKNIHANANNISAPTDIRSALNLYNQQKYAAAADAFERIIQTSSPNPTLYYYAALANRGSNRELRANQLFKYLVANYPNTQEAIYAQKALSFGQKQGIGKLAGGTELPDSVRNALSSDMQALLNTEMGKQAVQRVMREQAANMQIIKNAEAKGGSNKNTLQPATKVAAVTSKARSDHPFSAEDIAKDGAGGIDQSRYPNCWFEASMSALAQLPRGQRLLAETIRSGQDGKYIVRFRNDGVEYVVTQEDLINNAIHDKALWASIIECAELKKFPNNQGAEGAYDDQSRLEVGLGCITGCKAEVMEPIHCDIPEISAFIGSAIKSQNPIVAGTGTLVGLPALLVPTHAYTVIDFEPSRNMVTVRNPHGSKSTVYQLENDPQHLEFQQLNDGIVKLSLGIFQKYFHSVARSFI